MFSSLQPLIIGLILLSAGTWKIFEPRSKDIAIRSAFSLFFKSKKNVVHIFLAIGVVELLVGLLLLFPPILWWEMGLASVLSAGFVGYLLLSSKVAPQRPCGCLGAREVPLSWRTIVRAGLLLVLAITSLNVTDFWFLTLRANPWALGLAGAEMLLFLILSPELDWNLTKFAGMKNWLSHSRSEPNCAAGEVPLATIKQYLVLTEPYRALSTFLRSDLVEHWPDGCWSFLCFNSEYQGKNTLAVFAVSSLHKPYRVKAILVDEFENEVLLTFEQAGLSQ